MATINDVAKAAGVSVATISRVLNQSERVKPETRERILRIIEELKYAPDASAKALRSRKTNQIGVVLPDISVMFYMELLKGIENTAMGSDYNLIICDAQNQAKREQEYMKLLTEKRLDGLILINSLMEDKEIAGLAERGFPVVSIGREILNSNISSILVSNWSGACQAVEHLIGHGHTRIAYLRGDKSRDDEERFAAYRHVLNQHGIAYDPQLVERGFFTEDGGAKAFHKLVNRTQFTAVFAGNDEMAVGVFGKARELGIEVPREMAVVGFDNIRLARHIVPGLTTADMPKQQLGSSAARKLIEILNHGDIEYEKTILRSELVIRQSCGCE
ncbi:MAG TPA: LacI family DNA-binding transcriptional regulator [Bacillota bacterium]|nr:LacI family DNA-binding transcriptional regulator [Bacillota bacterium]